MTAISYSKTDISRTNTGPILDIYLALQVPSAFLLTGICCYRRISRFMHATSGDRTKGRTANEEPVNTTGFQRLFQEQRKHPSTVSFGFIAISSERLAGR